MKSLTESELNKIIIESAKLRNSYSDRIPIIIDCDTELINKLDKRKFLVPKDFNICQFMHVIRKRVSVRDSEALFLLTHTGILPPGTAIIADVFEQHNYKGVLVMCLTKENTFG